MNTEIDFAWTKDQPDEQKRKKYRALTITDWDAKFMNTLEDWANYSNCLKKGVACILVRDRTILSSGINGVPKGIPHPVSCPRLDFGIKNYDYDSCVCVHAEINALAQAAMNGINVKGATSYSQYFPCAKPCFGALVNAGIVRMVYDEQGGGVGPSIVDETALNMAKYLGIETKAMRKTNYGTYSQ